mmetsp:Transcript_12168/g.19463  ORF Transcript_12168/g.19463 Transcript_12168/m.19463 type:complete len:193 (-) Transcript_12168:100-678(-)|eukprot:CAMPEP_0197042602 /NCGR_PEP_ID=MMETSP1384-20130603/18942_1 /TAXON_ID=29189 /ORGANISM="Ammonia sp." /LENGTH=192 /DNA_ID=CAMNT_0042473741 /DNA_START=100 /DNA_END=678 /DNA_ORIENTATION=-
MGGFFAKALKQIMGHQEMRILMVGLDAAGKTTILYKLKLAEVVTTIPTIGFNVETVEYKNIEFTVWDIGGQHLIRPLWRHYYQGTEAVIFVVDSNDRARIDGGSNQYDEDNARDQLHQMLADDLLNDCAVLVLANKQDLPNAMSVDEISRRMQMQQLRNRDWYVQATCATTGDGLYEGLDWLSKAVNKKGKK